MSIYTQKVAYYEQSYKQAQELKDRIDAMQSKLADMRNQYCVMVEAQQLLATVSDSNTTAVLDYITGIVNKALSEIFPHDSRRIFLEKKMHNNQYAHINIKLSGTGGKTRDLTLQSGTGLRQVISFLFVLSTIEIRKGRRFMVMDEILSGLHPEAKRIVMEIMQIFAEEGFQFMMVEYGVNNVGRIYIVEKPDKISTVTPLDGAYNNEVFIFNRPPEEVDLSLRVDEESTDDENS